MNKTQGTKKYCNNFNSFIKIKVNKIKKIVQSNKNRLPCQYSINSST